MTYRTYYDLVADAKTQIPQLTPRETMALMESHPDTVLIDCREPNEFNLGKIPGAHTIPRGVLESNVERAATRDQKIVLYCAGGNRSALATVTLREMGFEDVSSMATGFRGWVDAGGEVEG